MKTINFTKMGYNFFLVPMDNGYYRLNSDSTERLDVFESHGKVLSIMEAKNVLIEIGQKIENRTVESIEKTSNGFKIKLS